MNNIAVQFKGPFVGLDGSEVYTVFCSEVKEAGDQVHLVGENGNWLFVWRDDIKGVLVSKLDVRESGEFFAAL